ncbi:MAG: pyridoxamine 5'-phosphate oxidase family protein [Planctomycetota bacterium]
MPGKAQKKGVGPVPLGAPGGEPTLDSIVAPIWTALERGRADRRHAFHHPAVVTAGSDGWPTARTVVLRYSNAETGVLGFHTDARSPKVEQLRSDARLAWHFYDPSAKIQLRVRSEAEVMTSGPEVDLAWSETRLFSRRCYLAPHAPSSESEAADVNLPGDMLEANPDESRSEAGRSNFCVVRGRVVSIEWLWLRAGGHMRARLDRVSRARSRSGWAGVWLRP